MNDYLMSESEIKTAKNQRKMGFELLPKLFIKQRLFKKEFKRLDKDFARKFKAFEIQRQRQEKQAENLRKKCEKQANALKQRHDKEVANLRQKIAKNEIDIAYYESITSGTASPESVYEAFKQRQNAQKERI